MTDLRPASIAVILGSGPSAPRLLDGPRPEAMTIVAINNAWRAGPDWDHLVHAGDFPASRLPERLRPGQRVHSYQSYVPVQNRYGGFVYAGGTMAFTAGYWALHVLKPDILAFFACDMTYSGTSTHFYGKGSPDPLRDDVTLQSLEAKSARLMALADRQGCACLNLSGEPVSRLVFPRARLADLGKPLPAPRISARKVNAALEAEDRLGYMVEDGEYWHHLDDFDADALSRIDDLWLAACGATRPEPHFA